MRVFGIRQNNLNLRPVDSTSARHDRRRRYCVCERVFFLVVGASFYCEIFTYLKGAHIVLTPRCLTTNTYTLEDDHRGAGRAPRVCKMMGINLDSKTVPDHKVPALARVPNCTAVPDHKVPAHKICALA